MNKKEMELALGYLQKRCDELGNLSIKDCPKCKHTALAQYKHEQTLTIGGLFYYQCLTCGTKFTCSNKCVCEII